MVVYLIQAATSGAVKIGSTNDVPKRMLELQVGNHEQLQVLRLFEGGAEEERMLHEVFAQFRTRGEWFALHESMMGDLGLPEIQPSKRGRLSWDGPEHPLRTYLIERDIHPQTFAEAIGVSGSALYRYLHWERRPHAKVLSRIAAVTGGAVQPNDFYRLEAA